MCQKQLNVAYETTEKAEKEDKILVESRIYMH